jgi:putative acetyltransferase
LLVAGPEVISLVAVVDGELVGHAAFTICGTADAAGKVGLVGPLAVAPAWQRKGIGSAIMGAGFDRMADAGAAFACVLGDPAYYSRFGFEAERKITPPYPLPEEWDGAWQSLSLDDGDTAVEGTLIVPEPWRKEVLWTS